MLQTDVSRDLSVDPFTCDTDTQLTSGNIPKGLPTLSTG